MRIESLAGTPETYATLFINYIPGISEPGARWTTIWAETQVTLRTWEENK